MGGALRDRALPRPLRLGDRLRRERLGDTSAGPQLVRRGDILPRAAGPAARRRRPRAAGHRDLAGCADGGRLGRRGRRRPLARNAAGAAAAPSHVLGGPGRLRRVAVRALRRVGDARRRVHPDPVQGVRDRGRRDADGPEGLRVGLRDRARRQVRRPRRARHGLRRADRRPGRLKLRGDHAGDSRARPGDAVGWLVWRRRGRRLAER